MGFSFVHPALLTSILASLVLANGQHSKPNIVILMVDDLGVADLGCFGNDSLKTPNIDKLASQGARLTHNLAAESICTPSRAAFLTGRYAIRSGMASNPGKTRVLYSTSTPGGLPRNETTFAKLLSKHAGYSTGMIGKWHLGLNKRFAEDFYFHPMKHGFQFFYGIPLTNHAICTAANSFDLKSFFDLNSSCCIKMLVSTFLVLVFTVIVSRVMGFWTFFLYIGVFFLVFIAVQLYSGITLIQFPYIHGRMDCFLMRNMKVVEQPIQLQNLTAKFTNEAVKFISSRKDNPFLLFMSYVKVHTPLFTTKAFEGHSGHSEYGDNVEEMDWSVGRIMSALDTLGITENTFVYFTSDHGPHLEEIINGEYHGGWKGIFKGGKGQSWEGGIRVPSIASWPSHIPAGIDIKEPTIDLDIFPTVLKIAGVPLPDDRIIDGKDLMPLLMQQAHYTPHEFMFHYCAKAIHAVRYRPSHGTTVWKAHFMTAKWTPGTEGCFDFRGICSCYDHNVLTHVPPLLYNITADPSERFPISKNKSSYKSVVENITVALQMHQEGVVDVPNQLENNGWFPWRQTCCNYPYCWCREEEGIDVRNSDL